MKQTILTCSIMYLALVSDARIWTSTNGQRVDADVARVNPNRTVVLKTSQGKVVTVPFKTFIEEDVRELESILALPFIPHPVSWQKMNALFGIAIWNDVLLWDDKTQTAARRLQLNKESKTDFMENYRSYPLGGKTVLGQDIYAAALYGGNEHAESVSFIFLNLGDIPPDTRPKKIIELIEIAGEQMAALLEDTLGKPERNSLGSGDLREKVWRWDWNGHAIMLSIQKGKYTALRIMPTERADNGGKIARVSDDALKQRLASCVERRDNGDVVVTNIPMIHQGPKGYCVPATWERYLRYVDIPADMYLLALAANTGVGGGTHMDDIIDATSSIISSNGRKLGKAGEKPSVNKIYKYIDKGLPVMWTFMSTSSFQREATTNTARRNGKEIKVKKNNSGQSEDSSSGGHICLIIGYNKQTGEIAISDSWGPRFSERWIPASTAEAVSYGTMNIIKW